ncbi:MFS general substrate transporter [Aspergillus sclerotioniger CBS 115572]|uniref:MFS general substrate transporter n=1 Tax=Aspergillus sclerotioniger CBS 115572 TaxID=1450535 RepID=A0A317VIZ3_9EURO|nr:MFS general substrate transporter [Aspergillus sclerotioniger CBS 115572]PWY73201.1 MFS general substrate transporter [Aspergillus sclerotioniger CBS 115572]
MEEIELQDISASPNTKHDQPISEQVVSGDVHQEKGPRNAPLVILCISCITFISSYLGGLVTVSVPQIATDLHLSPGMELWPVSMYALGTGCTLLISGAMSDAVGNKILFLTGCFLQSILSMACGLAQTGTELIIFRIISGVSASLCLPSAMSIISEHFPAGKLRNFAFALMGCGQPIGFGIGILLGGIFADTVGWRWGFYSAAIANTPAFLLSLWQLPKKKEGRVSWNHLVFGIDWIGAVVASAALAILSYALAIITGDVSKVHDATTITLFCVSGALVIGFVLWQGRQERRSKPTLIKNSLWKKAAFSSICVNVFTIWGAFNAFEQVANFFFQDVQKLSVLSTSVRFIPVSVMGLCASLMTGLILHRIRADAIITIATVVSSISPLLMALVSPQWTYWHGAFFAMCLNPIAADVLFTVSTILIAGMFPTETQGLAAGVFNTVSQVGRSIGLALVALISNSVTEKSFPSKDQSPEALLVGYRAAFWFLFAMNVGSLGVSFVGLRRVGNVGKKKAV